MTSYTVLTVFENTDTINEPVILLPLLGKVSFRQIGIIIGLGVMLPMLIYSAGSEHILSILPDPVFTFDAVNAKMEVTWDILIVLVPMSVGLMLGVPRPKLVPMDALVAILIRFIIHRTSVRPEQGARQRGTAPKSRLAGFAQKDEIATKSRAARTYSIAVTDLGIPKNITITLYDLKGSPMRNRLARAYIDDVLLSSITTDSDGMMGMTFIPQSEGAKRLKITLDGMKEPVVDAILDVKRRG